MDAGMTHLAAAAAFWFLIHALLSGSPLRWRVAGVMGERAFSGLFSLLSLVGLIWIVVAYYRAPTRMLWVAPAWTHYLAIAVMPVALFLFVGAFSTRNPTALYQEVPETGDPARGVIRITRHPFLWATILWSTVHVLANGNLEALLLFGSLGLTALVGTAQIDAKRRRARGEAWGRFAAVTSNVPFAAIVRGRNRLAIQEIGWWRPAIALGLWGLLWWAHPHLFGGAPIPL